MANNGNEIEKMYNEGSGLSKAKEKVSKVGRALGFIGRFVGRKVLLALGTYALPVIAIVVAVILILVILIGLIAFILMGPAGVAGKVVKYLDDLFTSVEGFVYGQDVAQVKKEDVVEIASYLDNMGFKLEGYGFAEKDDIERDDNGEVTDLDSSYLVAYLAAENKTYMIANQNFNLRDYFNDVGFVPIVNHIKLARGLIDAAVNGEDGSWGSGMIVINRRLWDSSPSDKNVKINRKEKVMEIKMQRANNGEEVIYQYNLDGWMGRYGKPIEFLLALHIGTMAPDFAYEVATGDEFDTKVYIRFKKVGTRVRLKYNGEYLFTYTDEEKGTYVEGWDNTINSVTDVEVENQSLYDSAKTRINGVPLYKQWYTAWKDKSYGNSGGTMQSSACGPTAFAMVASWATGQYVSPVTCAKFSEQNNCYVAGQGTNGPKFMPLAAKWQGFDLTFTKDKNLVIDTLKAGIPVIAAHGPGMFTNGGHFIVYAGINSNGNLIINDPGNSSNDNREFNLNQVLADGDADWYIPSNFSAAATGVQPLQYNPQTGKPMPVNGYQSSGYSSSAYFTPTVTVNRNVYSLVKDLYGFSQQDLDEAREYEKSHTDYIYKPYIRAVNNHWFRDLDFSDAYRAGDTKSIGGTVEIGKNGAVFEIEGEEEGNIFQVSEPKIVGKPIDKLIVESIIDGDDISVIDAVTTKATVDSSGDIKVDKTIGQTNEEEDGEKKQTLEGQYEGYRLDELFKNKYRVADGENGVSEEEYELKIRNTMRYAIAMLENVGTLDSQYILRDLKRYMSKRGFTFDNQYIITNPENWKNEEDEKIQKEYDSLKYEGSYYTAPSNEMNGRSSSTARKNYPLGSILNGGMKGAEVKSDEKKVILHHQSGDYPDGFKTGDKVLSPGAGTINVKGNTVEIKLTTKGVENYTVRISGFKPTVETGSKVKKGNQIGTTTDGDIEITMKDANGNAVNPADYLPFIVSVNASDEDIDYVARCIQAEANEADPQAMAAVAWCIINRYNDKTGWGRNATCLKDIVMADGQFEVTWKKSSRFFQSALPLAIQVAKSCIAGTMSNPCDGHLINGENYCFRGKGQFSASELQNLQSKKLAYQVNGGNVFFHAERDVK